MSRARQAAAVLAALRAAYGAALLVSPSSTTRRWLGAAAQQAGGGQVAVRALGAREIGIHLGALVAAVTGKPVRPWFVASIAGDCSDITSTFAARRGLPEKSPLATAVVAGASAAGSVAVSAAVDY